MSSAAAIRVADHLRPLLFSYTFVEGLALRAAVERISEERHVFIPLEVADALVREEQARRRAAQSAKNTARITDAVRQVEVRKRVEFELPARHGHVAAVAYAKGRVHVSCSCGAPVCNLARGENDAIEQAWYDHRDGTPGWKKE